MMTDTERRIATYIGNEVATRRKEKGWSQEALSRALVMSRQTVWDVEKGKRIAGWETLEKIADVLGCHVTDLLPKNAESLRGTRAVLNGKAPALAA